MSSLQGRLLLGLSIVMISAGLGCSNETEARKLQVSVEAPHSGRMAKKGLGKELGKGLDLAATGAPSANIWTITISPPTATPTSISQCTADFPWQEMYTSTLDASENDWVRFKGTPPAGFTYTINFTNGAPFSSNPITGISSSPTPPMQIMSSITPQSTCLQSNGTCAFPYAISSVNTSTGASTPCNNSNNPPFGSDGIVIKGDGT